MKQLIFTLLMGVTFLSWCQSYNPDANSNTNIDISDMLSLLSYYGQSGPWAPPSSTCQLNRVSGGGPRHFYIPDDCDNLYFPNTNGNTGWNENWFYLPDTTWQNRKVTFYQYGSAGTTRIVDGSLSTLFYCSDGNSTSYCDWDIQLTGPIRVVQFMYDDNQGWQRQPFTISYVNGVP